MNQGGNAFCDRPNGVQPHDVYRHAAKHGDDLNAVGLAVVVGVFPQRDVADPVPGVFNAPAVPDQS